MRTVDWTASRFPMSRTFVLSMHATSRCTRSARAGRAIRQVARYVLAGTVIFLFAACSTLPTDRAGMPSIAFSTPQETSLGRLFPAPPREQTGRSGFAVLDTGREALRARLAAVEMAEQAIDLQYYIWNSDYSGRLMAHGILRAADRGVRVRLLLDDFGVGDADTPLSVMDSHPNVEVRVFNPNASRDGVEKVLAFIGEFGRLNQRMHNKSLVADASLAIVGGRNIGDEYFDLDDTLNFRDRDVLAVGPIVEQVGRGFDSYWNSGRSFPIREIAKAKVSPDELPARRVVLRQNLQDKPVLYYEVPEDQAEGRRLLEALVPQLTWAESELLIDDVPPIDDTDSAAPKQVAQALSEAASRTNDEVLIESAYLVLGDPSLTLLEEMRSRGVRVRALTNSLASNDVTANHAAYARRRPAMLESGIELYELRPDAQSCEVLIGNPSACTEDRLFGLHSKTVVFDRQSLFIGSFNLNLRSVYLNSELGIMVHSKELAQRVVEDIEHNMRTENSWRVSLQEERRVRWTEEADGVQKHYAKEPLADAWRRFWSGFLSSFPIEKYL